MHEFFECLGQSVKDLLNRFPFWQLLILVVTVIFAIADANHFFP